MVCFANPSIKPVQASIGHIEGLEETIKRCVLQAGSRVIANTKP